MAVHSVSRVNEGIVALPSETDGMDLTVSGADPRCMHQALGVHSCDPTWLPHHALQDDAVVKSAHVTGKSCDRCPGCWVRSEVLPVADDNQSC